MLFHRLNISILLLLFLTIACNSNNSEITSTKIDAIQFKSKIGELENPQLIDVRTPEEYSSGHIPNAINININDSEFEQKIENLDKNEPILVYCRSGGRSGSAASILEEKGFKNIYDLSGGITAWNAQNYETVKGNNSLSTIGISNQEYSNIINNSTQLILIDFNAEWCAPCKKLTPILRLLSKEFSNKIKLVEIDIDKNELIANELKITGLPTLKLYKNGEQIWEHLGFIGEEDMREVIVKNS